MCWYEGEKLTKFMISKMAFTKAFFKVFLKELDNHIGEYLDAKS